MRWGTGLRWGAADLPGEHTDVLRSGGKRSNKPRYVVGNSESFGPVPKKELSIMCICFCYIGAIGDYY